MNKKITINGKDYKLKEIDFNDICDLEDLGLSLTDFKRSRMNSVRALLAYIGEMSPEEAGNEIMAHLKNGGTMDIINELFEMLSTFFQSIRQPSVEEETPTSQATPQA